MKISISQRGNNLDSKGGEKEKKSSKYGEKQRGIDGFKGRPSQHWMIVSIQASVSGSIYHFFVNFMIALIVLSSINKKGEIVTNMALFMPF